MFFYSIYEKLEIIFCEIRNSNFKSKLLFDDIKNLNLDCKEINLKNFTKSLLIMLS